MSPARRGHTPMTQVIVPELVFKKNVTNVKTQLANVWVGSAARDRMDMKTRKGRSPIDWINRKHSKVSFVINIGLSSPQN